MATRLDISTWGHRLLRDGLRPEGVHKVLKDQFPAAEVPSLRTIQRWRERLRGDGDWWAFAEAEAEDAAVLLPVLRAVAMESEGRVTRISNQHAGMILRVARAAPGIPAIEAYLLAGDYLDSPPEFAPNLDLFLAFQGWQDTGYEAFLSFVRAQHGNMQYADGVPLRPGDYERLWSEKGVRVRVHEEEDDAASST